MKRILSILLSASMLLCMAACAVNTPPADNPVPGILTETYFEGENAFPGRVRISFQKIGKTRGKRLGNS